jgi:ADP-ribose pyrophosphatase
MKWSVINKKLLANGFLKLEAFELTHDLFEGGESQVLVRELLDRGQAAAVLPYDPVRDELVLVEQFRIGALNEPSGPNDSSNPWVIEIIAGLQEPGEPADELVHREAEEEAGCKITDLIPVHHYYSSPGSSNEKIQIYFARTETEGLGGIYGLDEEGEDIRVHVVSSETAFEWLDSGRIDSALPIIALQWFRLNRDSIRERWL